ncbi:MAG: AAA family ATPase [Clostridia bacterium]|nr:AAA family ATPase [Clostridia bacterium]
MEKILKALEYINPALCSYQEWVNVGMALKYEGCTVSDWDKWSKSDKRYHRGECERKWDSFNGSESPVTGATIFQMARENGYKGNEGSELDWDSEISVEAEDMPKQVEKSEIPPHIQLITYLETLFESSENVGYVTETWKKDGRFLPAKGHYDRTAGQLIEALSKCNGDIGAVFGDYNTQAGAWIRFNPLDGNGVKNENVTDYRFTLVESDDMELSKQRQIIENLRLPVACLVFSGKKSIHAIVHVDASGKDEYRKRVEYIYKQCQDAGLNVDIQNKNPSRLSRMPGITRGEKQQTLLATNIGFKDFLSWEEYIESVNDNLPDEENLANVWNNLPELSPSLIEGILRQGHKMLIAGPSKAGKSFAQIELCIAIAENKSWFGFKCTQGRVLYVNLELDRASCLHRFKDVYEALKIKPDNLKNIDIWNLRGRSVPMDKLAPKLIRRAKQKNYTAVIIDPIYKVITGDENSADQMAAFCNQFDKICTELGTAVIYCHHHSKGSQAGKRSMDKASGSGVFARDPDALLDMSELTLSDSIIKQLENNAVCEICMKWLRRFNKSSEVSQDDKCSEVKMRDICFKMLPKTSFELLMKDVERARKEVQSRTAWRIEGTLREFQKFEPINLWFKYPIHIVDDSGILKNVDDDFNSKGSNWKQNFGKKKSSEERKQERNETLETAFDACNIDGEVSVSDLAEYMAISEKSVRNHLKEHKKFYIADGKVGMRGKEKVE